MSLSVVVPGSSANLGPGFDVLGLAVDRTVRMGLGERGEPLTPRHPGAAAFDEVGGVGPVWLESDIASGRGLGFSGASIVAGVVLGLAQRDGIPPPDLDRFISTDSARILDIATRIEGHPDNVGASLHGGVVAVSAGRVVSLSVGFDAALVAWIPRDTTSTARSRAVLPAEFGRDDVVFNLGRLALLIDGLRTGDPESLRLGVEDRLHQDRRLEAVPASRHALEVLTSLATKAVWLSGSGPTVMALCDEASAFAVCEAASGLLDPDAGRLEVMRIDRRGARQAT
ncbi:MAG: homoserine kinase [Acidimicrobiia bacterium]